MTVKVQTHPMTLARAEQGLSVTDLASKARVSIRSVERIELGQVNPRRATRDVLARALKCKPADLWPELEGIA